MAREPGSREQRLRFARELIIAHPEWGKDRLNKEVRGQFGTGLRRIDVAQMKDQVLIGRPKRSTGRLSVDALVRKSILLPEVKDRVKGERIVKVGFDEAYHRMRAAGFIDAEIRHFFSAGNVPELFNTKPYIEMLKERHHQFREWRQKGWSKQQVIDTIKEYYSKPKRSPFDFLRKSYRPPRNLDTKAYRRTARRTAQLKTQGLSRRKHPARTRGGAGSWMECPFCHHVYWGGTTTGTMPKCTRCGK